jgi:hypothetical protein
VGLLLHQAKSSHAAFHNKDNLLAVQQAKVLPFFSSSLLSLSLSSCSRCTDDAS